MKFTESIEAARLRFGAWNRERKEAAAIRKMEKQAAIAHDQHAHSRFWLLNVPALATICAAITEWYWAMLFCIEATGQLGFDWSTSTGSDTPPQGAWHFLFDIQNAAVLFGLIAATIPIVMLSMVWLPVQFAMRGAGAWRRGSIITVGILANVLVIVSGTVVMNYNRQDQVREAVVIEQSAQQGRAAIDARLEFEQEQLRLALNNSNAYLNQAANVGAAEWERSYVAQARATNDPRLPMLERALGAARAADQRRANIERLTIERAQARPEAATAANVEDTVGRELNTFAQQVEVWRPPFVAFICTLIGIFGAWWTLAMLERLNPRDVLRSGWADEAHRIEDLREQESVAPQPMKPAREVVTDAETGEELIRITPKPHWRKAKGKRQQVETTPDIPPDETGIIDKVRTAHTVTGKMEMGSAPVAGVGEDVAPPAPSEESEDRHGEQSAADEANQETQIEISETDIEELKRENPELFAELPVDEVNADESGEHSQDPDQQSEHVEPRDEPETDPSKLIANVAAE